jgi:hypothetical protein
MKLNPFHSSLKILLYGWQLPKQDTAFPLVCVEGRESSPTDLLLVKFRVEQMTLLFSRDVLIVDLSNFTAGAEDKQELLENLAQLHYGCLIYVSEEMVNLNKDELRYTPYLEEALAHDMIAYCPTLQDAMHESARRMKPAHAVADADSPDGKLRETAPPKEQLIFSFAQLNFSPSTLLIQVQGEYPQGAQGAAEGKMLELTLNYAHKIICPEFLIVDMRKLGSVKGNEWTYAPHNVKFDKNHPFRLLLSKEQEMHLRGLMGKEQRISRRLKDACEELNIPYDKRYE